LLGSRTVDSHPSLAAAVVCASQLRPLMLLMCLAVAEGRHGEWVLASRDCSLLAEGQGLSLCLCTETRTSSQVNLAFTTDGEVGKHSQRQVLVSTARQGPTTC